MPDLAVHYYFGQSVLNALPDDILIDHPTFDFALSGPDDWFYDFPGDLRCVRGKTARASYMHRNKTGEFLRALAKEPLLFSYFAGFVCHYVLDSTCHPYIISCTGTYDGTKESRAFRGNHMALERALDRWMLKEKGNFAAHPLTGPLNISGAYESEPAAPPDPGAGHMMGAPLPPELKASVDRVYLGIFGWENAYDQLLTAKNHMRRYLRLLEDPHNIVKGITAVLHNPLLLPLPYSREFYQNADILNLKGRKWHHPNDPALSSTSSFPELLEKAEKEAAHIITAASSGDLSPIGNRSYITGFDLDDPRNNDNPDYSLL